MFFDLPFTSNKFIFMIAEVIRKEQKSSNSDAERAIKRWFKEATEEKEVVNSEQKKNRLKPAFV